MSTSMAFSDSARSFNSLADSLSTAQPKLNTAAAGQTVAMPMISTRGSMASIWSNDGPGTSLNSRTNASTNSLSRENDSRPRRSDDDPVEGKTGSGSLVDSSVADSWNHRPWRSNGVLHDRPVVNGDYSSSKTLMDRRGGCIPSLTHMATGQTASPKSDLLPTHSGSIYAVRSPTASSHGSVTRPVTASSTQPVDPPPNVYTKFNRHMNNNPASASASASSRNNTPNGTSARGLQNGTTMTAMSPDVRPRTSAPANPRDAFIDIAPLAPVLQGRDMRKAPNGAGGDTMGTKAFGTVSQRGQNLRLHQSAGLAVNDTARPGAAGSSLSPVTNEFSSVSGFSEGFRSQIPSPGIYSRATAATNLSNGFASGSSSAFAGPLSPNSFSNGTDFPDGLFKSTALSSAVSGNPGPPGITRLDHNQGAFVHHGPHAQIAAGRHLADLNMNDLPPHSFALGTSNEQLTLPTRHHIELAPHPNQAYPDVANSAWQYTNVQGYGATNKDSQQLPNEVSPPARPIIHGFSDQVSTIDPQTAQIMAAQLCEAYAAFYPPYILQNAALLGQFMPPTPHGRYRNDHMCNAPDMIGCNVQSALLHEFRCNSRSRQWELRDIYNHVAEFSGDQHGSRFIQAQLETANSDVREHVFRELLPDVLPIMSDVFGNYVIQKFFEHGDQTHKKILADKMRGKVVNLSCQMYGCRVVQKALDHVLREQQFALVRELDKHVVRCVKDSHGNHVIQKVIESCPQDTIRPIVEALRGHVQHLSTHGYGCRVIQRCLEHCEPSMKAMILAEAMESIQTMIPDQFGNYVVQHIVVHDEGEGRRRALDLVRRGLETYSKQKFASNVVEKCVKHADDAWRRDIANAIVHSPPRPGEHDSLLVSFIKDQFANYVIQRLLDTLCIEDYNRFVNMLVPAIAHAKRSGCGKQVLSIENKIHSLSQKRAMATISNSIPHHPPYIPQQQYQRQHPPAADGMNGSAMHIGPQLPLHITQYPPPIMATPWSSTKPIDTTATIPPAASSVEAQNSISPGFAGNANAVGPAHAGAENNEPPVKKF